MKRIFLLLAFSLIAFLAVGQISGNGISKPYPNEFAGIDFLIVFNGIEDDSEIVYNGNHNKIEWYKFEDVPKPISKKRYSFSDRTKMITNQKEIYKLEDATGYIVVVDDTIISTVWVIDYKNYLPVFNSLYPSILQDNECEGLALTLDATIPLMYYKTPDGISHPIDREYTLSYQTKEWGTEWTDKEIKKEIVLPLDASNLYLNKAPLCDTRFKIEGDQFATGLGMSLPSIQSELYIAVAVEFHNTSITNIRNELNEDQRPSVVTTLEGSAPLEVLFKSNANVPNDKFYLWEVYKDDQLLFIRNDPDQRHTFNEPGNYTVKLTVRNPNLRSEPKCDSVATFTLKLSESALQVPSVFTPNGDGMNDEFRVAYRSLASFKCWIFSRWGRKVYTWTDPQKGWDGRVNGHDATPGGYIYLIEAVGTDGIEYKMKGVINLLRGKSGR